MADQAARAPLAGETVDGGAGRDVMQAANADISGMTIANVEVLETQGNTITGTKAAADDRTDQGSEIGSDRANAWHSRQDPSTLKPQCVRTFSTAAIRMLWRGAFSTPNGR